MGGGVSKIIGGVMKFLNHKKGAIEILHTEKGGQENSVDIVNGNFSLGRFGQPSNIFLCQGFFTMLIMPIWIVKAHTRSYIAKPEVLMFRR